ncbi:ABC transporter permease [bacterium]|nr:ABC transporter permease [bacterium]
MSVWLHSKRIARYGLIGFIRNGFVSLSAILMLTITLFVMAGLVMASAALSSTLKQLNDKVDVNVYFSVKASNDDVQGVKLALEALPDVAQVTYVSPDEALALFRSRHGTDQVTMQALDQLGDNPLGASLSIRAKNTSKYQDIANYLESVQTAALGASITKVNFNQNKTAIQRLSDIIETSRRVGYATVIIFMIASVIIAFNTIRLTIYTARDEIGVMNLVGAGKWYVRGPFMIAGVLYGAIAGLFVVVFLYPFSAWTAPGSDRLFAGAFNTLDFYTSHFLLFFFTLMGTGVALGVLSSFLAIRRYLR